MHDLKSLMIFKVLLICLRFPILMYCWLSYATAETSKIN